MRPKAAALRPVLLAVFASALAVSGCSRKDEPPSGLILRPGAATIWDARATMPTGDAQTPSFETVGLADLSVDGDRVFAVVSVSTPTQTEREDPANGSAIVSADSTFHLVVSDDGGAQFRPVGFPHDPAVTDLVDGVHAWGGQVLLASVKTGESGGRFLREIDPSNGKVVANATLAERGIAGFPRASGRRIAAHRSDRGWLQVTVYDLERRELLAGEGAPDTGCTPEEFGLDSEGTLVGYCDGLLPGNRAALCAVRVQIAPGNKLGFQYDCVDAAGLPAGESMVRPAFPSASRVWRAVSDGAHSWAVYIAPRATQAQVVDLGEGEVQEDWKVHFAFGGALQLAVRQANGAVRLRWVDPAGASGPEELLFPSTPCESDAGCGRSSTLVRAEPLGDGTWLLVWAVDASTTGEGTHPSLFASREKVERRPVPQAP